MSSLPVGHEHFTDLRKPEAEFERAIGRLTLAWAKLESGLAMLLNSIVDGRELWRGRVIYYAAANLQPRLQMIEQLTAELVHLDARYSPAFELWRKLKKRVQKEAADRRNNIVHGELVSFTDYGTATFDRRIVPFFGVRTREGTSFKVEDIDSAVSAAEHLWRAALALGRVVELIREGQDFSEATTAFSTSMDEAKLR